MLKPHSVYKKMTLVVGPYSTAKVKCLLGLGIGESTAKMAIKCKAGQNRFLHTHTNKVSGGLSPLPHLLLSKYTELRLQLIDLNIFHHILSPDVNFCQAWGNPHTNRNSSDPF